MRREGKDNRFLYLILILGFLLRVLLSSRGTYMADFNSWIGWSNRLVEVGFEKFYESWCDYLPGYLYVLWILGKLKSFFEIFSLGVSNFLLFKFPSILADLITGYLIYKIASSFASKKKALLATSLYVFNPAIIFNSTLWGQADSVFTLFLFTFFYFLINEKSNWSAVFWALASITKPQGLLFGGLVPFFLGGKSKLLKTLRFFVLALVVFFGSFLPFSNNLDLVGLVLQRFKVTLGQYPYTSLNAFNFWAFFDKMWFNDKFLFLKIPLQTWGLGLFVVFYLLIVGIFWKKGGQVLRRGLWTFAFLSLASFLFLTRVHERHLFPLFAFLTPLAVIDFFVFLALGFFSMFHVLNLSYAYVWLTKNFYQIFSHSMISIVSFSAILVFFLLLLYFYQQRRFSFPKLKLSELGRFLKELFKKKGLIKEEKIEPRKIKLMLFLIIVFVFLTRIVNLSHPQRHIFDEVYHAFTAQEMLKGNVAAWEWWNPSPEGFAYEWTHPPLAKLLMVFFMIIFNSNSFGWRVGSAVFGVGTVIFTYLLAKRLFKSEKIALLSCALLSFEGLFLVMSRIGMADSYFLFFSLLTIFLAVEKKFVLSGMALGLTAATKWTGIYLLPVLGLIYLYSLYQRENGSFVGFKKWLLFAGSYFLIPVGIYLLVYTPFLLTHSFLKFVELQKQMWWYHTRLEATHAYQSAAYTWPILYRPVWLYVKYGEKTIENIYALGNPIIFWSGLVTIPYLILKIIKKRNFSLLILLGLYFSFWMPWVFSPRIMFLYHYLPAVPFLCMAIAWGLVKVGRRKDLKPLVFLYLFLIMTVFIFFYPHLTGIKVPLWLNKLYYWFPSWK